MTRINCIAPQDLSGPHLVAEYRELPRIFALVRAAIKRGEKPDDPRNPKAYTLGKGHVRFFYPHLGFLIKRQQALIDEMLRRNYQPSYQSTAHLMQNIPVAWCKDWQPDETAIRINIERINERTNKV